MKGWRTGVAAAALAAVITTPAPAQVPLPQLPVPLPPNQQPPQQQQPPQPPPPPPPAAGPGDASVTARVDPAQTGFAQTQDLFPPLALRWSHRLEGMAGTPIIADNRVFVATEQDHGPKTLYAFDLHTGGRLWTQPVGGRSRGSRTPAGGCSRPAWTARSPTTRPTGG